VLSSADGSALFEMGNTKVLAAVFGPKPVEQRSQEDEKRAVIKCEYSMAAFSTGGRVRGVARWSGEGQRGVVVRRSVQLQACGVPPSGESLYNGCRAAAQ